MPLDGLLAQSTASASTWLTPLWLLSCGVLCGTLAVVVVFALFWLISRLPVIGQVYDQPRQRNWAGLALGGVLLLVSIPLVFMPRFNQWLADDSLSIALINTVLLAIAVVPLAYLLGFGILGLVSRRAMDDLFGAVREGALFWLSCLALSLSAFAVTGYVIGMMGGLGGFDIVKSPNEKLYSLVRLWSVKDGEVITQTIPPDNGTGTQIAVEFESEELVELAFQSTQRCELSARPIDNNVDPAQILPIEETTDDEWRAFSLVGGLEAPLPDGLVETLWIRNLGDGPAELSIRITTAPEYPEVFVIPYAAVAILIVFLAYFIQRTAVPKVAAIALSTFKTEVAQPIYLLFIILGSLFAVASIYIPYYTLGEDIKMLKDSVLTVILVFSIFMAVWAASKSIAEEIEGRTALTVLSKPIGRRDFILGKFLGITWSTGLLYVIMALVFLAVVSYKPVYDARESSMSDVYWQQCFSEMMDVVPALVLAFMETVVFIAISVAISTRLPIMANLMICFAIYVLGHLTPLIVQSSVAIEAFEGVVFAGQLIALVVPVLDHFNVQAALTGGAEVPMAYLGWSLIYCLIYAAIAMLLALVFFEDRDLA